MFKSTFFNYLYFLQSPQGVLGVGLAAPPLNGFQILRVLTRWRWAAHTVTPLEGLQVIPTALKSTIAFGSKSEEKAQACFD